MVLSIYLAGPDVFLPNARILGEKKREICQRFGFEGLFPLDKDDEIESGPVQIFPANCSLMRKADIGLFNLTPFRGPSADVGTVFELGFMFSSGKPVYGYANTSVAYADRVGQFCGPLSKSEARLEDRDGYGVEDFGLHDNLMIARAIEESGGVFTMAPEQGDDSLAAFAAFERCLQFVGK